MGASITLAGESLIAQKLGAQQSLSVARFVLANVPGLDPNSGVDRTAGKPVPAQIVGTYDVTQKGFVNPNQVVYSLMLGSDIGDFDFNWIGLETSENVLLAVAYVPVQQKRRNIPPRQIGNNVTRNFLVVFDGAQALTGIKIDASTWQHDFTVRLSGIDERERLSNRDVFGRACFHGSALELQKVGNAYSLKPGIAYVEGVRLELKGAQAVAVPSIPNVAWLDVRLQRELSDVVGTFQVVFGWDKQDYTDSAGVRHYLVPIAELPTTAAISDLRAVEPITGELIKHLAARTGDYPGLRARSTTKDDVGLGQIPNAISSDSNSDDPWILATTHMVQLVRNNLYAGINALMTGTTAAGKALKLATARTFKFSGAATGSATFDGTADPEIALTLANSGVTPGGYTKVAVNAKGIVFAGDNPTTLGGYGITDAYTRGEVANGFVKQGGGAGQTFNRVCIGWSSIGLKASVDDIDLGRIWTENNFNPSSKADKAGTLAGYGITDAYTIDQTNQQINYRVIRDGITTAGFAGNDARLPYFRRESDGLVQYLQTRLGFTPVRQGGGIGQLDNAVSIGWSSAGLKATVDGLDLGVVWSSYNFNPDDKANKGSTLAEYGITNAYTVEQTNQQLLLRTVGDSVSTVGFASGNPIYPYLRHKENGQVYYLQTQLGFTPVEQGGGAGQASNKIRYGWDSQGRGMRTQVDTSDMGLQWGEKNFYRPDSDNFMGVGVTGTSVQLPPGGSWCYSLMHYYISGQGVVGKSGHAPGGTVISFAGGATIYGFAWRYAP
ncbi:phage tail protein [Pseudomonas sp. KBS0710]|uniref:phage tail-collar fiber domain-containing protein n=1 Tax=Pseudomonas sp. KBS0710 TaxID=1179667 RepID=UPI00110E8D31|nr:phage tail protein [Pseudomonas sp. KBS0710]TSD75699.1 phage tail protein [Pseudomonas sp. KBS0710]